MMSTTADSAQVEQLKAQVEALEDLLAAHEETLLEQATRLEEALKQVRLAEELAEKKKELEASLEALRTAQAELIQASKMAAIGTLVAGLSHELNNPMGVILGFAQALVKRTPPDDPSRAALVAIETHARRCTNLVKALLDFSRKQPSMRIPCAVPPLLRRVEELSRSEARRRHVELVFVTPPAEGLPEVLANMTEIESTLLNLIGNALDATAEGGRVEVSAQRKLLKDKPGVELWVADTGCGIPPEMLPRIFDPFFTTKEAGKGTGLGLSITRKVIEAHGGSISVESTVGQGTRMSIWLPVAGSPAQPAEQAAGVRTVT
jgi:signal transduction histidine kinase